MSHSFGEGYATRSDEEGFGGTYGGNDEAASKIEADKFIHENHPGLAFPYTILVKYEHEVCSFSNY